MTVSNIQCYSCLDQYHYLGTGSHAGVCVNCGSQLVAFAGTPDVVGADVLDGVAFADQKDGQSEVPVGERHQTLVIELADGTDRDLLLDVRVDWDAQSARPSRFSAGDDHISSESQHWDASLVPDTVVNWFEQRQIDFENIRESVEGGL